MLMLLKLILSIFFDVEHVVVRKSDVVGTSVEVPTATEGSSVTPSRVHLRRWVVIVIKHRALVIQF